MDYSITYIFTRYLIDRNLELRKKNGKILFMDLIHMSDRVNFKYLLTLPPLKMILVRVLKTWVEKLHTQSTVDLSVVYLSDIATSTIPTYIATSIIYYYVFHGRVTLFFANNSLMQCRITIKFLHNFF